MTHRLLLALLLAAPSLHAQTREYGPVSLGLPPSTRTMAMGGAFHLMDPGSEAIFHNPSLLSGGARFGITAATFDSEATSLTMSASTSRWGGGVGVGLQSLSYSTDAVSVRDILEGETDLFTAGGRTASERVVTVGFSRSFGSLDWGVSTKAVELRLAGERDLTGAVDVGASIQVGRYRSDATLPSSFRFGLAVQNLGPEFDVDGSTLGLANRVTAGVSFQRWVVGPVDLAASAAFSREADGSLIPALGGEVAWWAVTGRTFTGWIGVRRVKSGPANRVSFGGSFRGDALGIEYAFQKFGTFGGAHRIGLSWR